MSSVDCDERLFEVGEAAPGPRVNVPAGKAKTFRLYDQAQSWLMPPSLDDWLDEGHPARFVDEVVEGLLDLGEVYASYVSASGAPPYDPKMMLKLLLWGYSTGVTSSREMERRCGTDVAFRFLSANQAPDYRSIARFRRRHLAALDGLFVQVLALCAEAGLVSLGRVALDGTKLRASASRHKAMSHERLGPRIEALEAEVAAMLAEAEETDRVEDEAFGADRRGDELPAELARRESRLDKLRAAKEAIEAEARQKAAAAATERAERAGADDTEARAAADAAKPSPKAQRSFTDPEARMMKTTDGFHYAYNAQAVVDEHHQVVLAAEVTQGASDVDQLVNMMEIAEENLEDAGIDDTPDVVLADAGYCSERNLRSLEDIETNALVATGRLAHHEPVPAAPRGPIPKDATRRQRMARQLRTKAARADYARRKAIVEPAFGQMKTRQRAGFLLLRGHVGAQGEWTLHTICHNLRKLANTTSPTAAVP